MVVSPARQIAFDLLRDVVSQGAYASELLYSRLSPKLSRADAALATELTLGTLRWQRLLDFLLSRHIDRPIERLDLEVLLALRLGLYQLRYLERVPAHAAVHESVELVKTSSKRSAAPFVNAILRRSAGDARAATPRIEAMFPADASVAERMGILYSHPTWMVARWLAEFGEKRTIALLETNNRPAGLTCTLNGAQDSAEIVQSLEADGLTVTPGRWLRSALTISGGNPAVAKTFHSGQISFQDEASQMVAHLVDARPGQSVLDLCAAPGGKTAVLARAVLPDGHVIAADLHQHRLRTARKQFVRSATQNVSLVALDATQPLPFEQSFDRILVDAPCSGTGTLGRNPEIRWRLHPADLAPAHAQQVAMLGHALALLAPGGRLVYATCSLESEENEQVVREVLQEVRWRNEVQVVSGEAALSPLLSEQKSTAALFDPQGFFRTFPPETHTDGFFAAILERRPLNPG